MKLGQILLVALIFAAPWIVNGIKFAHCDFEGNMKCELIHGIGVVIPPTSWITVWFDTDPAK